MASTINGAKIAPVSLKSLLLNPRTLNEAHWVETTMPGVFLKTKAIECPEYRRLVQDWNAANHERIAAGLDPVAHDRIKAELVVRACLEDWTIEDPYNREEVIEILRSGAGDLLGLLIIAAASAVANLTDEALKEMEKNWKASRANFSVSRGAAPAKTRRARMGKAQKERSGSKRTGARVSKSPPDSETSTTSIGDPAASMSAAPG